MNVFEEINPHLLDLFKFFDKYCASNSIPYSIECDEPNRQSYLVSKHKNPSIIHELIKSMRAQIEPNNKIYLEINPSLINGQQGGLRKDGTLLQFSLKPIQELDMRQSNTGGRFNKLDNFGNKLETSLLEHIDIAFTEPDVLLTHNSAAHHDEFECIKYALELESKSLDYYVNIIESTKDENVAAIVEEIIENCNNNIKSLNNILNTKSDSEKKS